MKRFFLLALTCLCTPALLGQASLTPVPKIQFINANGQPITGGQVFTYAAGTTTPLATYSDYTGTIPNTNPVILDSGGFANVWLGNSCYKFTIEDANSVLQYTVDHICATLSAGQPINPVVISAGSAGDANFNALRLTEQTNGEFDCDWLKNDGSLNYTWCSFYPWFSFPSQNTGWLDVKVPTTFFELTGGIVALGRYNSFPLLDPVAAPTITHAGAGGAGVYYSIAFLDSNSGTSLFSALAFDSGGYPTPSGGNTNTICWTQPGGYSNTIVSRGTDNTQVLDAHGSGVISQISSGLSKTPFCFTDSGQYSVVGLATLEGAFYNVPARNTSGSAVVTGRIWGQGSANIAGGIDSEGGITSVPLSNPPAPTVVVNAGSGTTTYYAVVYEDYVGNKTLKSASTSVSGGATPNNTISWNCYAAYTSADLIVSTDNSTWFYLTGSRVLPCEGSNYPSGNPGSYSFSDTGQTRTSYAIPTRNATGDIYAFGNVTADIASQGQVLGNTVFGAANVSSPLIIATDHVTAHGNVQAVSGDATHTGYEAWFDTTNTKIWHEGFDATSNLTVSRDSGSGVFNVNAPLAVGGTTVATSGVLDAGKLGATSAVAPAAALGTGSGGSGDTVLIDNGTWAQGPYAALGSGGDGSGSHCLLDSSPASWGSCTSGGSGITSLGFKNSGSAFGTMTSAGSMNFVGCTVSGADPSFTITCTAAPGGSSTQMQYNSSGSMAGDADLTYSSGSHTHTLGASGILDMHSAATSAVKLPGGFSTGFLGVTTSTGAISSVPGSQYQQLTYGSGGTPASMSTPAMVCKQMVCDDSTDDSTAFVGCLTDAAVTGGTVVLPRTGSFCKISSQVFLPATAATTNVNLEGCGAEIHDVFDPPLSPGCGLDLQYTGSSNGSYKMLSLGEGNISVNNMAFTTNAGSGDSNPFFFDAYTVVHFNEVSFRGANARLSASNDGIILGKVGASSCPNNHPATINDCFVGYGSTFHHVYFSHMRKLIQFGGGAIGSDFDYIFGDSYNGCGSGGNPTCSAIEFNGAPGGAGAFSNVFKNLEIEQGYVGGFVSNYSYVMDFIANTSNNIMLGINSDDAVYDATHSPAAVHFSSGVGQNFLLCGFSNFSYCVKDDAGSNFPNTVFDPLHWRFGVRFGDIVHLGADIPTNDIIFGTYTVASLPATANVKAAWVGDSLTGDCLTGGGSTKVPCFWNGAAWVPIGSGSSPAFASPNIGAATGVSLAVSGSLTAGSSLKSTAKTFATLDASPVDGEQQFCSDCKVTTAASCSTATPASCVCTSGGTGAFAKRMNYVGGGDNWYCQ